jgi:uncharacterized protein YjiS (DUF1127 family)
MSNAVFNSGHFDLLCAAFVSAASSIAYRRGTPGSRRFRWASIAFEAVCAGFATVDLWFARAGQRRQLAEFDDQRLQDIGITRADAEAEVAKPFWR